MRRLLDLARSQESRFWAKVDRSGECWLWTGAVDKDGYGKFQVTTGEKPKQIHFRAHRFSFLVTNGWLPTGDRLVRHSCDTPGCVRPFHLNAGTQAQNIQESVKKGRFGQGKRRMFAPQIAEARSKRSRGLTFREIAASLGVSISAVQANL